MFAPPMRKPWLVTLFVVSLVALVHHAVAQASTSTEAPSSTVTEPMITTQNGDVLIQSPGGICFGVNGVPAGFSSYKGDKGDAGPEGPRGPQGPQGERGAAGADGRDGRDGHDGRDGRDFDPSSDYLDTTITLPVWVSMHVGSATSGPSRRIVSPSGGASLRISGFGFEPFSLRQHDTDNAWDEQLFLCRFTDSDSNAKHAPVFFSEGTGAVNQNLRTDAFANAKDSAAYRPIVNANCNVPAWPDAENVTVSLVWNGTPQRELYYRGIPGHNVLQVLEFATHIDHSEQLVKKKTAVPIVHGFGFSVANTYYCRWALADDATVYVLKRARFLNPTELACDSFPSGDISESFASDNDVEVTVHVFYATPGDDTVRPLPEPPVGFGVGGDGSSSRSFTFPYKHGACGDGMQNQGEIGVDCGFAAGCGYCEPGTAQVAAGGTCELHTDCEVVQDAPLSCRMDKCLPPFSCKEILELNPEAESGVYTLGVDTNAHDLAAIELAEDRVSVYCEMSYDEGGWTLFEMVGSSQRAGSPFSYNGDGADEGAYVPGGNIGVLFTSNQNQAARLPANAIRSIFKHSAGYIQTRYANNANGYQLTDVFGLPEQGVHFLSQSCSHKASFDIAKAYRSRPGSSMGFCFRDGLRGYTSNCVCGDRTNGRMNFNACPNSPGNWRRYNSFARDNLWCSGLHTKCYSVSDHYVLGDSYDCNKGGQRSVAGHMWKFYSGNGGMPCTGYSAYNCYGSVWMR